MLARKTSNRRQALVVGGAVSQAEVDENDTGRSRAEAGIAASGATLDAQRQRISLLGTQREVAIAALAQAQAARELAQIDLDNTVVRAPIAGVVGNRQVRVGRSEEHTSELQSLMRISYAVFCLKKKTKEKQ